MNKGEIAFDTAVNEAAARWLFAALLAWCIGVQVNETLASLGLIATDLGIAAIWFEERRRPRLGESLRAWWPLVLFVAWAIAAPAIAGRLPTASGLARGIDWLQIPLVAYALEVLSERRRRAIAAVAAVVFLLSCGLAGLQHFGLWPSPSTFEGFSWTRIPFYRVYEPIPQAQGRFMAGGLLFHRLKFAHVGGLCVLGSLVLGVAARGRLRILALTTSAIGFLSVLVFPYTRAAGVALVASAFLTLALAGISKPRVRIAAFAIAALTLGAISAYRPMRERFLVGFTATGSGHRDEILSTGVRAVSEHPVAGLGLGNFRPSSFASADTSQQVLDNPGKAHNQFLSMAAETGVPGLALFLLLLGWLGRSFNPRVPAGVFGLGALAFFAILSVAHDPLFQAPFSMALSLSFGVARARAPISRR